MGMQWHLLHLALWLRTITVRCGEQMHCVYQGDDLCTPRWIDESEHSCNIPKLSEEQLRSQFGPRGLPSLYHSPIIIQRDETPQSRKFLNMTSQNGIVALFPPEFEVTLSSSNSFSAHRRTISLSRYLEEILEKGETTPDQLSNETWYFFGETHTNEWKDVLKQYTLPPCETCVDHLVALSFGIGNKGSGVQWHVHGPGFAEVLWGRKHWILYPADEKPEFHPDQTSLNWMQYSYPRTENHPHECTLHPGEAIYFPDMWWHATINLDPFTSFVSTFTAEHHNYASFDTD